MWHIAAVVVKHVEFWHSDAMTPAAVKTLMTLGAGLLAAACFLPGATPFVPFLTAVSGLLTGGAFIPQPSTANDLAARVEKAIRREEKS